MKKLMLGITLLSTLLVAGQISFAQSSAAASVSVNANVIASLSITPSTATLNFGDVAQGTSPVVAPASGIAFTVAGEPNHTATLVYNSTLQLNGPNGATLTFTANVIGNTTNSTSGATSFPSGITLNGSGNYYLWLGGGLGSIPANQATGAYSGNYTIAVHY
ncbi:MAG: DUF4402 domain-containing protein [Candidatus Kryptoniota bacterium]